MAASRSWMRRSVVAVLLGMFVLGGAQAAHANPNDLSLEVLREQAFVAPDGRSITFGVITQCDRKTNVIEARATAVQPQASGEATFIPRCTRLPEFVQVTVPSSGGSFVTGEAQFSARLVVREGRTKQVQDAAELRVRPTVSVVLADQAVLIGGGSAVEIDVIVTCPIAATGLGGHVVIYQATVGNGSFGPTACDGLPHTLSVTVLASSGSFRAGAAEAGADAAVAEGGDIFPNSDFRNIQIS